MFLEIWKFSCLTDNMPQRWPRSNHEHYLWVDVDPIKRQLSVSKKIQLKGEMTWIEHLHFYLGRALGAANKSGIWITLLQQQDGLSVGSCYLDLEAERIRILEFFVCVKQVSLVQNLVTAASLLVINLRSQSLRNDLRWFVLCSLDGVLTRGQSKTYKQSYNRSKKEWSRGSGRWHMQVNTR